MSHPFFVGVLTRIFLRGHFQKATNRLNPSDHIRVFYCEFEFLVLVNDSFLNGFPYYFSVSQVGIELKHKEVRREANLKQNSAMS